MKVACLGTGLTMIGAGFYIGEQFDTVALSQPGTESLQLLFWGAIITLGAMLSFAFGRPMPKDEFPADIPAQSDPPRQ